MGTMFPMITASVAAASLPTLNPEPHTYSLHASSFLGLPYRILNRKWYNIGETNRRNYNGDDV